MEIHSKTNNNQKVGQKQVQLLHIKSNSLKIKYNIHFFCYISALINQPHDYQTN